MVLKQRRILGVCAGFVAALVMVPLAPATTPASASVPTSGGVSVVEQVAGKPKTVTVKCPLVTLKNEGTGKYIYGTGKDKAAAVKNANDQVPRGFKLKHCVQQQ